MNTDGLAILLNQLRQITGPRRPPDLTDSELLERFIDQHDEAAFVLLMHRHGPMVLNLCSRRLGSFDAEDVFQATFLVLARKARSIRKRRSLASWLYGVAGRIAGKVRARKEARKECDLKQEPLSTHDPCAEAAASELRSAFDKEFASLPDRYRAPAILCLLEGKSHAQAAIELGAPRTTISSRLERARELLQRGLARRGIAVPSAALSALLGVRWAPASVPAQLFLVTLRAATGKLAASASIPVTSLANGVIRAMFLSRLQIAAAWLLVLAALGSFAGVLAGSAASDTAPQAKEKQRPQFAPQAAAVQRRQEKSKPSADDSDEPLPKGAVARLGTTRLRHGHLVRAVGFTKDGKALLSADWHRVHVWDAASGRRLRTFGDRRDRQFQSIAFSGDGRIVALSMSDGLIDIWDATTSKRLAEFQAGRFPALVLSPDGKTLVVHDMDWKGNATLRLWDAVTAQERHVLKGHTDRVHCLIFSRDGKLLISAGDDKSIRF